MSFTLKFKKTTTIRSCTVCANRSGIFRTNPANVDLNSASQTYKLNCKTYYLFDNYNQVYDSDKKPIENMSKGKLVGELIAVKVVGLNILGHDILSDILNNDNLINKNNVLDVISSFNRKRDSIQGGSNGIIQYLDNESGADQPTVSQMNRISKAVLELAKDKGLENSNEYKILNDLINDKSMQNIYNAGKRVEDFKVGQAKKIDAAINALIAILPKD